jgi:hypothetical protein
MGRRLETLGTSYTLLAPPCMPATGDSSSKMTIKSAAGASLRPDGMLRDKDRLRVLTKVGD